MRGIYFCTLLTVVICLVKGEQRRYDGYQVFEITPETSEHQKIVHVLGQDETLDFWSEPRVVGLPCYLMMPPHKVHHIADYLSKNAIPFKVFDDNVQRDLDAEQLRLAARSHKAFDVDDFNTYDDIMAEMELMVDRCHPDVICETYVIGQSYYGRDIKVLRMSKIEGIEKKAFWLDSAIHSREWLAPATLLKILDWMIEGYGSDSEATQMMNMYDWYFMPIMNPDGYVYSWTNDRYWRKNRRPGSCTGVDLNRNFDVMWRNAGTSTSPCSNTYGGPSPASEVETQLVQAEARRLGPELVGWVSIHTAAQMWLMPWGHVDDFGNCVFADDNEEMLRVCDAAADATQNTYGTTWTRGSICSTIYPASGGTTDYAKAKAGVKYPFTPELRGPGFVVSSSAIPLSFQEMKNGVIAMAIAASQA